MAKRFSEQCKGSGDAADGYSRSTGTPNRPAREPWRGTANPMGSLGKRRSGSAVFPIVAAPYPPRPRWGIWHTNGAQRGVGALGGGAGVSVCGDRRGPICWGGGGGQGCIRTADNHRRRGGTPPGTPFPPFLSSKTCLVGALGVQCTHADQQCRQGRHRAHPGITLGLHHFGPSNLHPHSPPPPSAINPTMPNPCVHPEVQAHHRHHVQVPGRKSRRIGGGR